MEINELLKTGFRFKKNLGQNFISDVNLLKSVVSDAGISSSDAVLEIGTGAATLTRELCKVASSVVTFELDETLLPIINDNLKDFDNVSVRFLDVLKLSDEEILSFVGSPFKVVANLPYYVTTPMIMRFVESGLPVTSLTLMMQKEVAARLTSRPGTADYGSITVAVAAVADVRVTRFIDRKIFFPSPNVDSALVRIDFNREKYVFKDFSLFKKTVRSAFTMRRKTLVNNLASTFPIDKISAEKTLVSLGFSPTVRGETLSVEDFIRLSDALGEVLKG